MAKIQPIDIQFRDLTYEVQVGYRVPKKQILKGLNGLFKFGELTAIMGPSGAGKSTLLNVLSGFQAENLTGTVDYIGDNGKRSWDRYKKQSCYIQQTDCLYGLFTVNETMMIAAYLKIDNGVTKKYRQILIDDILDTLNLTKVKETRAKRLSGGQRKRLSIALELIDNPPIMFLDEPTTGLDSLASMQCLTALRTLANAGRTVICTIHQPSATLYQMFDHIYLMMDGHYVYAGTPNDTVTYFAQQGFQCPQYHNPADYMLEVINREFGNFDNQLIAAAKNYCHRDETSLKSRMCENALDDEKMRVQISSPSEMTRFGILVRRSLLQLHRDWSVMHLKLIIHFFVAVLLGLLYEHAGDDGSKTISNVGYMMVTMLYLTFTSMMPAVLKFPLELAILKKERFNNWYQLRTYYVAMLVISIPAQALCAFVYCVISYLLSSQPLEWSRFFMYLAINILTTFASESMGLGLGTIFNPINGTFVGSIIVCTMLCLAGFLAHFKHMPLFLYYVSYLNYFRYSMDGLVQAIYGNDREKLDCSSDNLYCHYRMPSMILEELHMSKPMFWIDIIVLLSYFVIFRIVVYVGLKRRLSKMC